MPHKSLQYYKNTVILKFGAYGSWVLDRFGLLERMKAKTRSKLDSWLLAGQNEPVYLDNYLAYGFLGAPEELAKLLVFDQKGIPLGWKHARPSAHNPLMVSYYALVCWNHYEKTGSLASMTEFLKMIDFLVAMGNFNNNGFWLPYHQSVPLFKLSAPWYSGLAHALAMSAFIRAYHLTARPNLLAIINGLCHTITQPKSEGGFVEQLYDGGIWIQEYPTDSVKQVLNGLLFCLIGLYEYQFKMEGNPAVAAILANCEATMFKRLPNYLVGKYTRYSYGQAAFSNIEYEGLYVFLFLHLHQLSGKMAYKQLASQFNNNTDWPAFFGFYEISNWKSRVTTILFE